jgi:hypothetical protein
LLFYCFSITKTILISFLFPFHSLYHSFCSLFVLLSLSHHFHSLSLLTYFSSLLLLNYPLHSFYIFIIIFAFSSSISYLILHFVPCSFLLHNLLSFSLFHIIHSLITTFTPSSNFVSLPFSLSHHHFCFLITIFASSSSILSILCFSSSFSLPHHQFRPFYIFHHQFCSLITTFISFIIHLSLLYFHHHLITTFAPSSSISSLYVFHHHFCFIII